MKNRKGFRLSWIAMIAIVTSASVVVAQDGRGSNVGGPGGGQGGQGRGPGGQGGGQGGPGGQRGGQRMGAPRGPMLLLNPQVIKELKETDEQVKAIQALLQKNGQGGRGGQGGGPGGPGGFGGGQGGPGGPGGRGGQGGGPGGQGGQGGGPGGPGGFGGGQGGPGGPGGGMNPEEGKKMEEAIKKILNAGQYKRYRQIDIQVQGPRWFTVPEVDDVLNLSEKQHDQIDEIMKNGRPPQGGPGGPGGQQGGPGGPGGQQGGPGGDMAKFADDLMKKIMSVLNESQRNKYKEMTGAQFKLERPQGGPGGPGGGQGGPGRGGPGGGGPGGGGPGGGGGN